MTTAHANGHSSEIVEASSIHTSTELAPSGLFGTDDPVRVIQKSTEIADALKDVITQRGLYSNIQGKAFVQVEGWRLLGAMVGVTASVTEMQRVDNGFQAAAEAHGPDGRLVGRAYGLCTREERRWAKADDTAIMGMASTRATSRALRGPLGFIVSLAGYEATGAEEMPAPAVEVPAEVVQPAAPAVMLSAEQAKILTELVKNSGQIAKLNLAVSHVTGAQCGDCSTPAKAIKVLQGLTTEQGDRIAAWAASKSEVAA
jgi:hypothetical protein